MGRIITDVDGVTTLYRWTSGVTSVQGDPCRAKEWRGIWWKSSGVHVAGLFGCAVFHRVFAVLFCQRELKLTSPFAFGFFQQWYLRRVYLLPGFIQSEKLRTVHLRKFLQ